MTDHFTAVETAIYSQLTSTAGTALWVARVYAEQVPEGATLPYLLFFNVVGQDDNDMQKRALHFTYQVEVWAADQPNGIAGLTQARQGAGYIDTAFHHQTLTVSGYTNYWTVCTGFIRSVENVSGKQIYRRGREVEIRLSS